MIPITSGVRVWLATGYTDMRRGFPSLALQVQEILKRGADTGIFFAGAKSRGAFSAELTPQDKEFLRAVSIKPER